MSTTILYVLLPVRSNSPRTLTKNVDVYEELRKMYSTNGICEQILDQVLNDLNQSIGNHLEKHECFSANELLQELNISVEADVDKGMIPQLSMSIISKLLQLQCIQVNYENRLPCPSYFVKHLFEEYAKNNVLYKENMEKLMENLKIGRQGTNESDTKANTSEPADKLARRKRQIVKRSSYRISKMSSLLRQKRQQDGSQVAEGSIYEKCYSADELFSIYHVGENDGCKMKRFESLSIALLDQIESNVCKYNHKDVDEDDNEMKKVPDMAVWGFGLAAVSAVSLISLFMILPLLKTKFYKKSLVFLIALAIGTLVGDSMFYLLPRATGFQGKNKDYYWKFFSVVGGIYGFFIFETTAHLLLRQTHTVEITPKNKKYTEKNTVVPKTSDKNQNKLDNPAFIVANKLSIEGVRV
ncbi:zinc transporter ZIP14-like isoform X3 [Paramuricea clavata]|uniref:Zinc transporter ZIP14-like isoform X3 n=1 Tax=Paramuricea clavata TaxID=317549 RepID=A0A7D9DWF9_PARCT|nr:zinc transporter ZIP14-like isoform X3 [Paramuricea clavata]